MTLPYFDADTIRRVLPFERAIQALEDGLRGEVDPERDSPRLFSPAPEGEFLLMPTEGGSRYTGVKVATIAPGNPARGLDKIQGVYALFDADTLAPLATMEGATLTAIRTPATTLTAVKHIAAAAPEGEALGADPRILVFGAGVQGLNHVRAARAVFPDATVQVVGRNPQRLADLVATLAAEGIPVTPVTGDPSAAVREADIIVCVSTSPVPLFDGSLPRDGAIIASVGQHGLDAREVDATLVRRSDVVVEGRASSWRESGDLIPARSTEEWQAMDLPNLKDLVGGRLRRTPQTCCLFTGVGMSWEDLTLAGVVYEECTS
ncbi:ornithine cyclodeaminase family protein (plasmid) [Citricoccus sp. SGAir0253]|uniref:ornithine cyclodeaminase family protein n=1 Tax=Citricoccus sp. SGAir0253 TaxID=2567881 RepID=UPI0010CCC13B|nr:ornithine cyclodeaminase family protein [Citricoccus sp. SGAir0253]QCU79635.1 ornithine cyclodeaminase family protein [Citricoccus sp. SGAir0253]